MKSPITFTKEAIQRLEYLLSQQKDAFGIRISLKTKGCSGLSYTLDYVNQKDSFDELVEVDHIRVLIDHKALLFILGTEMHYVESPLKSGFVFKNPNEKGTCGCGKSFHV